MVAAEGVPDLRVTLWQVARMTARFIIGDTGLPTRLPNEPETRHMTIRPVFAWYDLWVGVFIDRAKKRVYVLPLPCLGFVISWGAA